MNYKIVRTLLPMAVGAGCMITFLSIINAVAGPTSAAPHTGDIISFPASVAEPAQGGSRLTVRRDSGLDCTLDLGTLRHSGGSLIVESEATEAASAFRVHWAGQRTASGASDCGTNANLIVGARDLDTLARSAGGYGIVSKRLPVSVGGLAE